MCEQEIFIEGILCVEDKGNRKVSELGKSLSCEQGGVVDNDGGEKEEDSISKVTADMHVITSR